MAITLVKLCEGAEKNYSMQLVAGKNGVQNTVRWVHMVEDIEVPDFLHGGELIFTTGIGHVGSSDRMLGFVKSLFHHDAAGIVFNIGPYIHDVPDEVLDFCDKNAFPVYTLPWRVHIIDITYDFCTRIIENKKTEMSVVQAFRNLISHPEKEEDYRPFLEKNGFSDDASFRAITVGFFKAGRSVSTPLYRQNQILLWRLLAHSSHSSAVIEQDSQLLILRQNCTETQLKRIAASLKKALDGKEIDYFIGISDSISSFAGIPTLCRQASAAYVTARHEKKPAVFYRDIGINSLILAIPNKQVLEEFVQRSLGAVLEYDRAHGSDYTPLLKAYIDSGCSVQSVAADSGVHRNTINNKIKLIRTLVGGELSEPKKAELLLAFQIKDLIQLI